MRTPSDDTCYWLSCCRTKFNQRVKRRENTALLIVLKTFTASAQFAGLMPSQSRAQVLLIALLPPTDRMVADFRVDYWTPPAENRY
jgi:hypothetical protein